MNTTVTTIFVTDDNLQVTLCVYLVKIEGNSINIDILINFICFPRPFSLNLYNKQRTKRNKLIKVIKSPES